MQIDITSSGFVLTEALKNHAQRRLRFAMDRSRQDVRRIFVRLADINGPRGGPDKRCRVHIPVAGGRDVLIEETGTDMYGTIDTAIHRAWRTLARRFGRRRSASRSVPASDSVDVAVAHQDAL